MCCGEGGWEGSVWHCAYGGTTAGHAYVSPTTTPTSVCTGHHRHRWSVLGTGPVSEGHQAPLHPQGTYPTRTCCCCIQAVLCGVHCGGWGWVGWRDYSANLGGQAHAQHDRPPPPPYTHAHFTTTSPPPVLYLTATQALLKHLEARRRVVYVDEYNTSQFCPECDTRLVYHSNREKRCDECKTVWNRDLVGALNQKKVFEYWWQHGERPAHLCRPAAPESTPGAAAATARRSRKRRAAASDLDPDPDLVTTGGASAAEGAQQPGGPPARRRAKVCVCMCVCMCVCAGPRKSSGCERGFTRGGLAASSWLPPPPLHQCIPTPTVTVVQLA